MTTPEPPSPPAPEKTSPQSPQEERAIPATVETTAVEVHPLEEPPPANGGPDQS
jgi:hypothetical protein